MLLETRSLVCNTVQNRTRSCTNTEQEQKVVTLAKAIIQYKMHIIKPAYIVTSFPSQNTLILRAVSHSVKNCYFEKALRKSLRISSTEPDTNSNILQYANI